MRFSAEVRKKSLEARVHKLKMNQMGNAKLIRKAERQLAKLT